MTIYELIQELVTYPADVEVNFKSGNYTTDNIDFRYHGSSYGDELTIELC